MQNQPLVSVICLCYNQADYVIESLNSVLKQTYPNVELIIVDDCSNDNSVAVIEDWLKLHPKIQFINNLTNLGNTKTFNKASQFAKGDYLIDLAADDILLPDCISKQIEAFQNSKLTNLGIVYGNVENITDKGLFKSYYYPVDENNKVTEKRKSGNIYTDVLSGKTMCSVSAMTKREVFEALNGYDENLAYEDLDFWIRASRIYDFEFIDAILIQKRATSNAMTKEFHQKNSNRNKKMNYSTYRILNKALKLNRSNEENKALLKRVHYEISLNFKTSNYELLLKYLILKIKLQLAIL